jgi:hypothetical protein
VRCGSKYTKIVCNDNYYDNDHDDDDDDNHDE